MNNAPFRVGQRVVCVATVSSKFGNVVVKGSIYTILGVRKNRCCKKWMVDVGISQAVGSVDGCPFCRVVFLESKNVWAEYEIFAPIPPRSIEIPESLKEQAEEMKDLAETITPMKKELV